MILCFTQVMLIKPINFVYTNEDINKPKDRSIAAISLKEGKDIEVFKDASGQKLIHFGIGKRKEVGRREFITITRKIIQTAKSNKTRKIAITFSEFVFGKSEEAALILTREFEMANFEFVKYKTMPKEGWNVVEEVIIHGDFNGAHKENFKKGQLIGIEVNKSRELANTPGGEMTPRILAEEAQKASKNTGVKVKVLGRKDMESLKMGAVLGVSQGSNEEPQFIILEYNGADNTSHPIVLVGKGVTFDTGGLNLKPSNAILEMHMDMSGGAAVIHAVVIAAKLKLKKNVIGLVPAVENMPSGTSYRPGDILRSMSGKTIEILNTDAEGRVILADALTYAKRYNPRLVVDVATLTGAALAALGQRASAIMTRDEKLENLFRRLGEESGDYVWPLPLWKEYEEDIKGNFADVANLQTIGSQSCGGAIAGGMFLNQFAKDYPWVHIDIAPRMTTIPSDNLAKGSAGAPIRLLVKLLEEF